MRGSRWITLLAVASALLFATAGSADTVIEGSTDGGALVKIAVPDNWNGGLVIYNHGFDLLAIVPSPPSLGAFKLAERQLAEGYAVAASSYQQNGWALYKTKNDLQNLVALFRANFGEPSEVFVWGVSLGGIVTAQAIEKANLGNVVGAYPVCGAVAGSRSWDGALDLRLVYDAICADVAGADIPGGPTGLPARFTEYLFDIVPALGACFYGEGGLGRLGLFLNETDIPPSFIGTDMSYAVYALSDLIFDPAKLDGKQGMGNIGVEYDNDIIDATIERVAAHPGGEVRNDRNYTPTGKVGDVKIISTHTSGDGLVIVEQEQTYRDVVPAENLTTAIVNEAPYFTHCGYSDAEVAAGWEALRGWVYGAEQPTVEDIQDGCKALVGDPEYYYLCRYDPDFVIPNMDIRTPPR